MALSTVERQRRSRRHRRGDHGICDPLRCPAACPEALGVAVTAVTETVTESRGQRLWRQMTTPGHPLSPAVLVLLQETCRIADRLDRLHAHLEGGTWLEWVASGADGTRVTVVVDGLLAETRHHAVALKGLVTELRQSAGHLPADAAAAPTESSGISDLTARIAARRDPSPG